MFCGITWFYHLCRNLAPFRLSLRTNSVEVDWWLQKLIIGEKKEEWTNRCNPLHLISFWRNTDNWVLEIVARHLKPTSKFLSICMSQEIQHTKYTMPYVNKGFLSSRPQLLTTWWPWVKRKLTRNQSLLKLTPFSKKNKYRNLCIMFFDNLIDQRKISSFFCTFSNSPRIKVTIKMRGHRLAKNQI